MIIVIFLIAFVIVIALAGHHPNLHGYTPPCEKCAEPMWWDSGRCQYLCKNGHAYPDNGSSPVNKNQCDVPPEGWACSRPKGHDGPCAATPTYHE